MNGVQISFPQGYQFFFFFIGNTVSTKVCESTLGKPKAVYTHPQVTIIQLSGCKAPVTKTVQQSPAKENGTQSLGLSKRSELKNKRPGTNSGWKNACTSSAEGKKTRNHHENNSQKHPSVLTSQNSYVCRKWLQTAAPPIYKFIYICRDTFRYIQYI